MSDEETKIDETEMVLVRTFPVEFETDGRTIDARIVPYNVVARVTDALSTPPSLEPYEEMWMPGAFDQQLRAANRIKVWVNVEHEPGLRGIVGHGDELVSRTDGLHGTFRIHENADGDKALQLVNDGLLTGMSLEAVPQRSKVVNGIVQRVKGRLLAVALARPGLPAFRSAQVLAVRTRPFVEELPPFDAELAERAERFGIVIPEKLKASEQTS